MSEELIPPFTGPMSKQTAQIRATQAVEYYHRQLHQNTHKQKNLKPHDIHMNVNGFGREGKNTNTDGRQSVQSNLDMPPERFVRGGQRATVHGTHAAGRQWQQHQYHYNNNNGTGDINWNNQLREKNHREPVPFEHRAGSKKRYSKGLHRSNSNLEESMEYLNVENLDVSLSSKREFGSTSSLDVMNASASSDSFFQMLDNLRPVHTDQRSPAPSRLKEVLRGSHPDVKDKNPNLMRDLEKIANGSVINNRPLSDETDDGTQSPRTKQKFKQKERKQRSKTITTDAGPGVWKRIRGKNDQDPSSKSGDSSSDTELKGDDRFRRKAFVHYDSQSIGFDTNKVLKRKSSVPTFSNISTGASAASGTRESYAGEADDPDIGSNTDDGDGRSNDLVHSCSFFRNEIGGEEERTIALTQSTAQTKPVQSRDMSNLNKSAIVLTRSPHCCGVTILDCSPTSVGHILPPHVMHKGHVIEFVDTGAYYYRHFFNGQEHQNYFGIDDNLGPVAVSVKREKLDERENNLGKSESGLFQYRVILRTSELNTLRGAVLEDAIPASGRLSSSRGVPVKDMLEFVCPEVQTACLRQATAGQKTADQLMKLDEQRIFNTYKIGILYCKQGQSTEEDMYNNEHGGPAFDEFLNCIGEKVRLKGFEKYRAQLDNKSDSTGTHSVYTTFNNAEIMFHVSTLLPFTPKNQQQLLRKRHIGNDIVTIIFQEPGSQPFTAKSVRSQFQHVFIIVRVHNPCSDKTSYSIAISRSKDVPPFGPTIPEHAKFPKSTEFADFLLAKVVNGENAAHHSEKFSAMAIRTRQEYLKDLATNYVTNNSLESASKLSKFALSGKKKEKNRGKLVPDNFALGAVVWFVQVEDAGRASAVACYLGVAAETLVIVEEVSKHVIFTVHCGAVIGWTSQALSLKLYYNQGECLVLKPLSGEMEELQEIISRLTAVTPGCETEEFSLKRNGLGQLGFHIQAEGIVTDVEKYGFAYEAGLRKGSRLVEICKVATVTLTHDQMVDLLRTSATVKVVVIPPLADGVPRGVVNLHANHHYSSLAALNAVIEAEYSLHQRQTRTSSSSSDLLSPLSPLTSPRGRSSPLPSPRERESSSSDTGQEGFGVDRREKTVHQRHHRDSSGRESSRENWELREIKLQNTRAMEKRDSGEIKIQTARVMEKRDSGDSLQDREASSTSLSSHASQRSNSNTLPKKSSSSSTSSAEYNRGELTSLPNRTFYITDSTWQTSSLPRSNTSSSYHGYQDSTVSSGRGSLFEGRDTGDQYGSRSRGLDDSSYGTLEDRHTRSGSKDSGDQIPYGSSGAARDWGSSTRPQRPPPPAQTSLWPESSNSSSITTYLTSSTENLYSSSTPSAPVPPRKPPPPTVDYTAVQHGNYAQELLKQSQNTKFLLAHGEGQRKEGGNSANSSSINLSDTSFSSGGSATQTAVGAGGVPQAGPQGAHMEVVNREDALHGRRRANTAAAPVSKTRPTVSRNPGFTVSPLSSEHSSPRSSQKNLSGMSSEESLSTRLRPGVTTKLTKHKGTNNLQDDLMRLIDPDIPDSDLTGLLSSRSSSKRLSGRLVRTMSDESLHSGKAGFMLDEDMREMLKASRQAELRGSRDQLKGSKELLKDQPRTSRLSPRAMGDMSRMGPATSRVPVPDSTASLDWSSLVNVATKAIEGSDSDPNEPLTMSSSSSSTPSGPVNKPRDNVASVKLESLYRPKSQDRPPDPPSGSNPPVWRSVVANPQQRIQDLEAKVEQLAEELAQERQESAALDSEVQRLRHENARLQEESQNAAAQLRRFTEWFFTTIDRQ